MDKVNLSLNGVQGTLWEIRRQEHIHWYLGYRQTILIIRSIARSLKEGRLVQKQTSLNLETKRQELTEKTGVAREISELEIEIAESDLEDKLELIRDSTAELEIAISEKERIEREHPEIHEKDYHELQHQIAKEAFENKLVRAVAIGAYSIRKMLPEGATEIIYDMSGFSEIEQQSFSLKVKQKILELMPELATHPPEYQQLEGDSNGFSIR